MKELEEITNHSLNRMTMFQLSYLILSKEPTVQAKLHRCIEELKVRKQSIFSANLEIEEINDNIRLLEIERDELDIQGEKKEIFVRKIDRKIIKLKNSLEAVKLRLQGFEEESQFFVSAFKKLKETAGVKSWDDNEVQLEYWSEKYNRELCDRLALGLPIDVDLIRSILVLPKETQVRQKLEKLINKVTCLPKE